MTEVDVALTDFALAVQAAVFALILRRTGGDPELRRSAWILFCGLCLAALMGGIWHGFLTVPSPLSTRVWWLTMVAAGVAAAGYMLVGLRLWGVDSRSSRLRMRRAFVGVAFAIYAVASARTPEFSVTLWFALPATLICAAGLWRQVSMPGARVALCGVALGLLAGIQQQLQLHIDPEFFTHNAVYHVLLLIAHYLVYRGLQHLLRAHLVTTS